MLEVATAVHEHVANVIAPSLPEGVQVDVLNDESQTYSERAELLLKNGALGLILVLVALTLFLEVRLAVWVVVGLATSLVGVLAVMLVLDVALDLHSLFVFVLAIGIIVDDAIIVAEQIHSERQRGTPGLVAAIRGARRIKVPLTFAVLTSIVAFTPVFFVPGGIGDAWVALPIMIIAMLLISLFESLFVLPNHLSHLHGPEWVPTNAVEVFFFGRTKGHVDRQLARFVDGPLDPGAAFRDGPTRRRGRRCVGAPDPECFPVAGRHCHLLLRRRRGGGLRDGPSRDAGRDAREQNLRGGEGARSGRSPGDRTSNRGSARGGAVGGIRGDGDGRRGTASRGRGD